MSIRAWLEGDDVDLQYLAGLLPNGYVWVKRHGNGIFYLSGPDLDSLPAGVSHLVVAGNLLAVASGIASAMNPDFRPVAITGGFSEDGKPNFAQRELTLEVRPNLSASATVTGPWPNGPAYTEHVRRNADMTEALAIVGRPHEELNFVELYKIYEIIEDAGALEAARLSAGVSKASVKLFIRTANHQAASGAASRHARSKTQPPSKPMPVQKARMMVSQLLAAWIMNSL